MSRYFNLIACILSMQSIPICSMNNITNISQLTLSDINQYRTLYQSVLALLLVHKKLTTQDMPVLILEKIIHNIPPAYNPFHPLTKNDINLLMQEGPITPKRSSYALSPKLQYCYHQDASEKGYKPLYKIKPDKLIPISLPPSLANNKEASYKTTWAPDETHLCIINHQKQAQIYKIVGNIYKTKINQEKNNRLIPIGEPLNNVSLIKFSPLSKYCYVKTTTDTHYLYQINSSKYDLKHTLTIIQTYPHSDKCTLIFSPYENYILIKNDTQSQYLLYAKKHNKFKPVNTKKLLFNRSISFYNEHYIAQVDDDKNTVLYEINHKHTLCKANDAMQTEYIKQHANTLFRDNYVWVEEIDQEKCAYKKNGNNCEKIAVYIPKQSFFHRVSLDNKYIYFNDFDRQLHRTNINLLTVLKKCNATQLRCIKQYLGKKINPQKTPSLQTLPAEIRDTFYFKSYLPIE